MALWQFTNLNKHGNHRTRIIHTEGALGIPGSGLGPSVFANRFKYKYTHPVMSPGLTVLNGKKYLMPLWKEVDPNTTLDDIEWIKPLIKKQEPTIEINVSSSNPDIKYKTSYYPDSGNYYCNCPGKWMAKDGRCKHIKALELKINK